MDGEWQGGRILTDLCSRYWLFPRTHINRGSTAHTDGPHGIDRGPTRRGHFAAAAVKFNHVGRAKQHRALIDTVQSIARRRRGARVPVITSAVDRWEPRQAVTQYVNG